MDKITLTKQIEHTFEAAEVARIFCSMDDTEMAIFFNTIGGIVQAEWENPFAFQLAMVNKNTVLNEDGRGVMSEIGEFAS